MNFRSWIRSALESVVGIQKPTRRSVWKQISSGVREIQPLEQKCLLSGTTASQYEEALQPFIVTDSAGNVQYNALGAQDLSSLTPQQQQQLIYGPWQQSESSPLTPPADGNADIAAGDMPLPDTDGGGVWGTIPDDGLDGVASDFPPPDGGNTTGDAAGDGGAVWGTIADDGWDDVGEPTGGAGDGGAVWGTIADDGWDDVGEPDLGNDTGVDDLVVDGDTGTAAGGVDDLVDGDTGTTWGGVDDLVDGDTGAADGEVGVPDGDTNAADGEVGLPDGGADIGNDIMTVDDGTDIGADMFGVGDMPWPDGGGDAGNDAADGDGGTDLGTGGGEKDVEVQILNLEGSFLEGPYTRSKRDRAKLEFERKSIDSDQVLESATVTIELTGTAKFSDDYHIVDELGDMALVTLGRDGSVSFQLDLNDADGVDLFYLVSRMDGDYELPETVIITIADVSTNATIGAKKEATSTLTDATGDVDLKGEDEDTEDKPGVDLFSNMNDSDENGLPDAAEVPWDVTDPDISSFEITPHVEFFGNDYRPVAILGGDMAVMTKSYFVLDYDPSRLRLREFNPWETHPIIAPGHRFSDTEGVFGWIEGLSPGPGIISLIWVVEVDSPGSSIDGHLVFSQVFDTVSYFVWGLDLDIDSDNEDGFELPDGSTWEEYLEPNEYAIGKMLSVGDPEFTPVLIHIPSGLDFDNPNLRIRFSTGSQSGAVRIWRKSKHAQRIHESVENGGDLLQDENNLSGQWTSLKYLPYDNHTSNVLVWLEAVSVADGHDAKQEIDANGKPEDELFAVLSMFDESRNIMVADNVKYMVVKPKSFYPTLNSGQEFRDAFAAEMVYGVRDASGGSNPAAAPIDDKRWALRLLKRDELEKLLRAGLAGYEPGADEWNYLDIILDNVFPDGSATSRKVPGFGVAVYLDYCSGNLVVSFRGTNFTQVIDWIANIAQGATGYSEQYRAAQQISVGMLRFAAPAWHSIYGVGTSVNTGHSLGGGLASAGAIAAGTHANTFNAAGLYGHDTFKDPDTGRFWYPGSDARYDDATTYVTAWKIIQIKYAIEESRFSAPDVLSWLQDTINFSALGRPDVLPSAVGFPKALEGLHELTADELTALTILRDLVSQDLGEWGWADWLSFVSKLVPLILEADADITWESLWEWLLENDILPVNFEFGVDVSVFQSLAAKMAESHAMEHVYHGLFTRRSSVTGEYLWNVYHSEYGIQ